MENDQWSIVSDLQELNSIYRNYYDPIRKLIPTLGIKKQIKQTHLINLDGWEMELEFYLELDNVKYKGRQGYDIKEAFYCTVDGLLKQGSQSLQDDILQLRFTGKSEIFQKVKDVQGG